MPNLPIEEPSHSLAADAMVFAMYAHEGQVRDGGGPYISHPAQTAAIIMQVTDDAEVIAAAWLHDVLEDTPTSYEVLVARFGKRVADLVNEVTHETTHKGAHYFPRLKSKEAIMLKLADRLSNISDMKAWDSKRQAHYLRRTKFWPSEPDTTAPSIDELRELEDALMDLHICDSEGFGCEIEKFQAYGGRHSRCRLRLESLQTFLANYIPKPTTKPYTSEEAQNGEICRKP